MTQKSNQFPMDKAGLPEPLRIRDRQVQEKIFTMYILVASCDVRLAFH
jgi:hypothetical protein